MTENSIDKRPVSLIVTDRLETWGSDMILNNATPMVAIAVRNDIPSFTIDVYLPKGFNMSEAACLLRAAALKIGGEPPKN